MRIVNSDVVCHHNAAAAVKQHNKIDTLCKKKKRNEQKKAEIVNVADENGWETRWRMTMSWSLHVTKWAIFANFQWNRTRQIKKSNEQTEAELESVLYIFRNDPAIGWAKHMNYKNVNR